MITETKPTTHTITVTVNGQERSLEVEPRLLLVHLLREKLGLTGTHVGCDTTSCGACTVLVDGVPVKSCTHFAVQVDGREVKTVEGLKQGADLHPVQQGFTEEHGLQCGFCTPGMMLVSSVLLEENPDPTEEEIRWAPERQHLPLHGLPEHRQSGAVGRDQDEGAIVTAVETEHKGWLGRSVKRKEDARFIVGRGNYIEDIKLPNMLYMAILRSPFAHAKINSIDTSRASELPGRGRRRDRRDPRAAQPRLDADALGRHAGRPRHRQGADARAGGRVRDRGGPVHRARRARADRGRLRPAPRRDHAAGGARSGRAADPRRQGGPDRQPRLPLGGGGRRGDGEGVRRGRQGRPARHPLPALPPGAARVLRLRRGRQPGHRQGDDLHDLAGAARAPHGVRARRGPAGAEHPDHLARHRRRLRQQGADLSRLRRRDGGVAAASGGR